jgi:hypothetical protein
MKKKRLPIGYWTYERCKEEVLKYETTKEFRVSNGECYKSIKKNGWWDDICGQLKKSKVEWNEINVKEEALKYEYRYDFSLKSSGAYAFALRNKILNEVCSHMEPKSSSKDRYIYVFEFEDSHVYVGLSYDVDDRKRKHLSNEKGTIYKHIEKTNSNYKFKVLEGPIFYKLAGSMEKKYIKKYKNDNWVLLNTKIGGELGGSKTYWTYKKCYEHVNKFKTITDLHKNSTSHVIRKMVLLGWYEEMTKHLINDKVKKNPFYWTYERCKEESSKYSKRAEFQKNSNGAYKSSYRNKWLDEFYS